MEKVINLIPIEATYETFADFGQIIEPSRDCDHFGPNDAQLYIMPLQDTSFGFSKITHHANVTQCIGSIGARVWYLGVSKPSLIEVGDDDTRRVVGTSTTVVESKYGHLFAPPPVEEVRVFRVSGTKFVKYNRVTWHVGPLFSDTSMDFYNLELSDTDVVDERTYDFRKNNGVIFRFEELKEEETSSS
ncbi:PREDICTED: uncharacterized protein LOC104703264 [Camelina sativa]|uniref:Uncharacterized protein LOC104703264 n=1 Tax=Camelina sativa TaxID=90675 RepID=A0ABM0SXG6_CAMSA|nr:PREDICTED: uncharacterized protein LOC104703264 [Camelina sativa]